MSAKEKLFDSRVKSKIFPLSSFVLSFLTLLILITGQMLILRNYVNYESLPLGYIIAILIYWTFVAAAFALFTQFQFKKALSKTHGRVCRSHPQGSRR